MVLLAFGLALVLSVAAPAWGQIGLLDDPVDTTGDLLDETIQTLGDLDTGVEIIDDTVDTTVDVVDDVVGTVDDPADPEPEPDPELPPGGEPQPTTTTQPDRTQAVTDDRDQATRADDGGEADLRSPPVTAERTDESEDEGAAAVAGRDFDDPFDIFAADRLLAAATTGSASTVFDRALDWLTSSGSLLAILAGPLLALQVLLRALLSAGSGLVAPASLLAAVLAVSLHERRGPRAAAGS